MSSGTLCPSCGSMAPAGASECPECGTSLFNADERTHIKARFDDIAKAAHMGRTLDSDAVEDMRPVSRTKPHPAIFNRALASEVPDSTIPFTGKNGKEVKEHDTGPDLNPVGSKSGPNPAPSPIPRKSISRSQTL